MSPKIAGIKLKKLQKIVTHFPRTRPNETLCPSIVPPFLGIQGLWTCQTPHTHPLERKSVQNKVNEPEKDSKPQAHVEAGQYLPYQVPNPPFS